MQGLLAHADKILKLYCCPKVQALHVADECASVCCQSNLHMLCTLSSKTENGRGGISARAVCHGQYEKL